MAKHKHKHTKKTKVSWCDGWGDIDRHPTSRKISSTIDQGIQLSLCPDCLRDFEKYRSSI